MLVDTTVLVSAHDPRDRPKPERALGVLDRLIGSGRAVLSAHCRSECFVVVTRRLPEPLAPAARVVGLTPGQRGGSGRTRRRRG